MPAHWPRQGAAWTPHDQYGPAEEHAQRQYPQDFEGHPLNALVVREWNNRDDAPGGKVVFLTRLLGVRLRDPPQEVGNRQDTLKKDELLGHT